MMIILHSLSQASITVLLLLSFTSRRTSATSAEATSSSTMPRIRGNAVAVGVSSSNHPNYHNLPHLPSIQQMLRVKVGGHHEDDSDDTDHHNNKAMIPPLHELIQMADQNVSTVCPDDLIYVHDVWSPNYHVNTSKIVHITMKSRCMSSSLVDNLETWRQFVRQFDYSLVLHTDIAMLDLVERYAVTHHVPQLWDVVQHCAVTPTMKTDIWRAIALYEYGGIYTDVDNAPGSQFVIPHDNLASTTTGRLLSTNKTASCIIQETDDAFFVVEKVGILSQYFMVTNRRYHPLMKLLIEQCIMRSIKQPDIYRQLVYKVTGPNALREAFRYYMNDNDIKNQKVNYNNVAAGIYTSSLYPDWSITVVGTKETSNDIIYRDSIPQKYKMFKSMNMTHYHDYYHQMKDDNGVHSMSCTDKIQYENMLIQKRKQQS